MDAALELTWLFCFEKPCYDLLEFHKLPNQVAKELLKPNNREF